MSYINSDPELPGILGLLYYKYPTGKAVNNLVHTLLHGPSGLSKPERELIGSYVSNINECEFCRETHGAVASAHLQDDGHLFQCVIADPETAPITPKLKALLGLARKVAQSGRTVSKSDIENAKNAGANDEDIHDAVLIAATFCMLNRWVDGLGTHLPDRAANYIRAAKRLSTRGYKHPPRFMANFVVRMIKKGLKKV